MDDSQKSRWNAVGFWVLVLAIFLIVVTVVYFTTTGSEGKPGWVWGDRVIQIGGPLFCNVLGAFLIGSLGAWAFIVGVNTGLIARNERKDILEFIAGQYALQAIFVFMGGVIAAVFQLAQPSAFTPIQALVLGATWPAVLGQYLSGKGKPDPTNPQTVVQLANVGPPAGPAGERVKL